MSRAGSTSAVHDRTTLGIALILGSVLMMSFADALVKLVSADITIWQLFAVRSIVAVPLLLGITRIKRESLRLHAVGWSCVRSGLLVLTWLAFYASLPVLTLSVAAVAVYTNPIITALLSAQVLGERVTRRQWVGVLLGFAGVVVILQPGSDAFSWYTLLPLLAAVCYALAMVLTRSKCQIEAPLALGLNLQVGFLLTGLVGLTIGACLDLDATTAAKMPFLLGDWSPLDADALGLLVGLGVMSAVYFVGVARAYQIAPPSVIATFDYAYLVWAALWGFLLFAEIPGPATVAGMALITSAGLLVAVRPPSARRESTG